MFHALRKPLSEQEEQSAQSSARTQHDMVSVEPNLPEAFNTDLHLVGSLRHGDEAAFTLLFNRYYASMLRLTHIYAPVYAKEIVQETWSMILTQLDRFKGQTTLKVWIFRFLRDSIKVHVQTEGRAIPDFARKDIQEISTHPTVASWRFFSQGNPDTEGRWEYPPQQWLGLPEDLLTSPTLHVYLQQLIEELPPELQEIITLRDSEGWTADEVCSLLEITDESQRVLLHHARAQIRHGLEQYFNKERS